MALDKPLDIHNTGMPLSYWRITHTKIDHAAGRVEVMMHGWRDEAARRTGCAAGAPLAFDLNKADLQSADLHSVGTAALYAALKHRAGTAAPGVPPSVGMRDPALLAGAGDC